jgi:membrane-associated protein
VFDGLTHLQASPLTYLAVLGACALDAVLPIVPSEAVVIAASLLATRGEVSIWLVALAAAAGGFLGDTGS